MLDAPLARLLPVELLEEIVYHLSKGADSLNNLKSLSLVDRGFTLPCQSHIFRTMDVSIPNESDASFTGPDRLRKMELIIEEKWHLANSIRSVMLSIESDLHSWIWTDPHLERIFQKLNTCLTPPHTLSLWMFEKIEAPYQLVDMLNKSFFSRTLTVLRLYFCDNLPITIFLVCPGLKHLYLSRVTESETSHCSYPDAHFGNRSPPALEVLSINGSSGVIGLFTTVVQRFRKTLFTFQNLRRLKLCFQEESEIRHLQKILDAASTSLEDLHIKFHRTYIPLSQNFDFQNSTALRTFVLHTSVNCKQPQEEVVTDIGSTLRTTPTDTSLEIIAIFLTFTKTAGIKTFTLDGWEGLCTQILRIGSERHGLQFYLCPIFLLDASLTEENQLRESIREKISPLFDHTNISTTYIQRLGVLPRHIRDLYNGF